MSIYFVKAFANEPDVTFLLMGTGSELARTIMDNGFVPRDLSEGTTKEDIAQIVHERDRNQDTFEVEMHVSREHLTEASTYF